MFNAIWQCFIVGVHTEVGWLHAGYNELLHYAASTRFSVLYILLGHPYSLFWTYRSSWWCKGNSFSPLRCSGAPWNCDYNSCLFIKSNDIVLRNWAYAVSLDWTRVRRKAYQFRGKLSLVLSQSFHQSVSLKVFCKSLTSALFSEYVHFLKYTIVLFRFCGSRPKKSQF